MRLTDDKIQHRAVNRIIDIKIVTAADYRIIRSIYVVSKTQRRDVERYGYIAPLETTY